MSGAKLEIRGQKPPADAPIPTMGKRPDDAGADFLPDFFLEGRPAVTAADAYTAVERLAGVLRDPLARERIRVRLHGLFSRFVEELKFHERVIAKLVVTERTLDRALDSDLREGINTWSKMGSEETINKINHRNGQKECWVGRNVQQAGITWGGILLDRLDHGRHGRLRLG